LEKPNSGFGQFQEAKKTYQLFYDQFEKDPLIPYVHWKTGFCEYRLGGLRDSTETFKKFQATFKDHPLSPYTHFILGEISLSLGDYALAVKELTPVLQILQPNPLLGTTLLVFTGITFSSMKENNPSRCFNGSSN